MTSEEFRKLTESFVRKATDLMHSVKAGHYGKTLDRLVAFKRGAEVLDVPPESVCLAYMTKHWVHLVDMVKDGERDGIWRKAEEWDEVLTDLINYCLLMKGILIDTENMAIDRLYKSNGKDGNDA